MDYFLILLDDSSFWLLIVFISFAGITFRPIKNILLNELDERTHSIARRINEASTLLEEAKTLLETSHWERDNSTGNAQRIIRENKEGIERLKSQAHSDFLAECARRNKNIALKITLLEGSALTEIREKISTTSIQTAKILIEQHITQQLQEDLVTQAIEQVQGMRMASVLKIDSHQKDTSNYKTGT